MENTNENMPVKFNPGPKGVQAMNGRSKDEQKEYRKQYIEYFVECYAKGMTAEQSKKAIAAKFNVSERQAKNYMAEAKADIGKRRNDDLLVKRDKRLIQAEYMYREAVKAGDRKEAREWWQEMVKIEGLYAPKQTVNFNKHEVENVTSVADTIDIQDLAIMESILNKPKQ